MKMTAVFLLTACLQLSARTYSQTVTISVKGATLEHVFAEIKKQSGYGFYYKKELLARAVPVNLTISNAPLEQALNELFKNQPVTYNIVDKNIVLREKEVKTLPVPKDAETPLPPPVPEISGRVKNDLGEPLAGASVVIKPSGIGTVTQANGNFILHPKSIGENDVLEISFVGYATQSIKLGATTNFNITLIRAISELDETIVQGYGTTSRRISTGNIARVTSEDIAKQPVLNPLQALQSKIPGVVVSQTTGFGSGPVKVEIRGRTNFNNGVPSDPLYIIDGVPLTVSEVGGASTYSGGSKGFLQNGLYGPAGGQSPFFSINPSDIESMEVLKDADATAIYGSRGANGVILITTKKGKAGKTKLDINISQGASSVSRYWDLLNTQQYLAMRREAYRVEGRTPTVADAQDLLVWDTTRYTNWQKEIWGNIGSQTNAQLSLTGGDASTSFRIGANYTKATNILAVSGADQRGALSLNLTHRLLDQKLTLSLTANYSYAQSDMNSLQANIALLSPDAPSIYDTKGNLNYTAYNPSFYPFASLLQPYTSKTNFLNTNLTVNYQIIKGLNFKTNLGYNNARTNQVFLQPIASLNPTPSARGTAQFGNNFNNGWIVEPQLEYNSFISQGKLNVLVGASKQYASTDGARTVGSGYTSDLLLRGINNAPTKAANENYGEYKYAAVFARINYNWKNKYILNLNARRDGSSRFGPGKQYGNFGSAGAAWVLSEEKWVKQHAGFISFAKLRGSYGTTGSDAIGDYQYLSRWGSVITPTYGGQSSLLPTQHANPDFQWQVNKKLEGALDIGVLKDRVSFTVAYYQNRCDNQLVNVVLPFYTGFNTVTGNWPAVVQNQGWELGLTGKIIDKTDLSWTVTANIAFNRNKLLDYPNLSKSNDASRLEIGKSVNIVRLLHFTGVDPQTGTYTFQDKNQDGVITTTVNSPINDLYSVDLAPKYTGGFGTNLSYKGFQLSAWFQFVKQTGQSALAGIIPGTFGSDFNNMPTLVLDRWQKPGDITNVARFSAFGSDQSFGKFYNQSDGVYVDASFMRLANLSLSYNIPGRLTKKLHLQNCRLFVNGQNLLTLTKYQGIDPETQSIGTLPTPKIIVGGISITL
ncbi:MAG: SusC/RagA family TonB-linked outer membrane protein [Bacteroidota bacterium]